MKKTFLISVFTLSILFAFSQQAKFPGMEEDVAFDGNDLVSYYESDAPVKGSSKYSYQYQDLKLQFSNQENLNKFKSNPEKYIPAYNGWCAIALAHGNWIRPDFNQYKVQDGKLLFFEVRAFFNGKTAWEKDPAINKVVADKKWEELTNE
ncbi:MAG: YHS domain-containing (seleno)protein [Bacteroidota bacterium]